VLLYTQQVILHSIQAYCEVLKAPILFSAKAKTLSRLNISS
jgi:hypothetical protein